MQKLPFYNGLTVRLLQRAFFHFQPFGASTLPFGSNSTKMTSCLLEE